MDERKINTSHERIRDELNDLSIGYCGEPYIDFNK